MCFRTRSTDALASQWMHNYIHVCSFSLSSWQGYAGIQGCLSNGTLFKWNTKLRAAKPKNLLSKVLSNQVSLAILLRIHHSLLFIHMESTNVFGMGKFFGFADCNKYISLALLGVTSLFVCSFVIFNTKSIGLAATTREKSTIRVKVQLFFPWMTVAVDWVKLLREQIY